MSLVKQSKTKRGRLYPDTMVFWAFLHQNLSENSSCANAVALVQHLAAGKKNCFASASTASYCAAWHDLPKAMIEKAGRLLLRQLNELARSSHA